MHLVLFYAVILLSNIIQGITGFAGTILAMPPSLMLVGYPIAKPVLNFLGIAAGGYVYCTNWRNIDWKQLKKVVLHMAVGIVIGIFIKSLFEGRESLLYKALGTFIIIFSVQSIYRLRQTEKTTAQVKDKKEMSSIKSTIILLAAGIVHGMFVCGGPLLIAYLSQEIKNKVRFRATISSVWIILNTIIFIDDLRVGFWSIHLWKIQLIAIPFLFAGIIIGTKLYAKMSQQMFLKLTYILLFVSGWMLLIK